MSTEAKHPLKSKTILYSLALIALGAAEQAAEVLPDILQQQYLGLVLGALGAVTLVLRFLTGRPLGKAETKADDSGHSYLPAAGVAMVLSGAALMVLIMVQGCGLSAAQRVNLVGESAYHLKEVAAPAWSKVCKAKAETCVEEGVTSSEDCEPWVDCQAALKRFYQAHVGVQRGVQTAAWWLLQGDQDRAMKVIGAAQRGLAAAYELAKAEGAIQ